MPAAQGTLSPPLPTAEVFEMGTDVAAVACGDGGCRMQVYAIRVCVFMCLSPWQVVYVSTAASGSDLCLSVLVCQLASANTLAAWCAVVCLRDEEGNVCVLVGFPASCGE